MNPVHEQRYIEKGQKTVEETRKKGKKASGYKYTTHIKHKNFVEIQHLTIFHVDRMELLGNILQSPYLIP